IVHLDDPELVTNPTHAVERFPVGGAAGPPAHPAYWPYSISVANGQAFVANSVSKTFEGIDLASRTPLRSIPFVGTGFVPGEGVGPNQRPAPPQAPDGLALVDVATGVTIASRPTADCVKPHQIAGLGKRYFLTCEGDHVAPSVVLEIDPATLSTIRTVAVGVYPDVIAFAGGP